MPTLVLENDEAQCDAPCHNTNVFAPGAYKVKCDACNGHRGHYGQAHQWAECRQCEGTGSVRCPRCMGSGRIRARY